MRDGKACVKNTFKVLCRNHINLIPRELCLHCSKPTANSERRCGRKCCRSNIIKDIIKILPLVDVYDIENMARKDVEKIIKDAQPTEAQLAKLEPDPKAVKAPKAPKAVKEPKAPKEPKAVKAPKVVKDVKPKAVICGGKTKTNAPCKRMATGGAKFCSSHIQ
jgi:hypothetical protein